MSLPPTKGGRVGLLLSVAALMVLTACTTPRAVRESMLPVNMKQFTLVAPSVAVVVKVEDVQLSTLPPPEFKAAIETAVVAAGLFGKAQAEEGADAVILARVTSLDAQAAFAWDREVRLVVDWELRTTRDGRAVWKDLIATKFVTTTKDASAGIVRTKLSTEGAARANIREAVEQIGELRKR